MIKVKKNLPILCVNIFFILIFTGCDIPFLSHPPTIIPTKKSIITFASSSEPTVTNTLEAAGTQIPTATFSVEEWKKMGPNKYFEFLAPIRMRDFEIAYNKMAQQMETLSANEALWNDWDTINTTIDESTDLLLVSSKLADVDSDVNTVTGSGAVQYEKTYLSYIDIYNKVSKFGDDFSIFTDSIGDNNRRTKGFNDSMQDMKDISDLYNQVLATYKQEGGPPF